MNWQQELKAIKKDLQRERARQARAAAQRRREPLHAPSGQLLFERAMADVTPLSVPRRIPRQQQRLRAVSTLPQQRLRDEQEALQESLSDDFDPGTLLHIDDRLSFRRRGIGPDVPLKLRRGVWSVQAELDLHGMTRDEAREQLNAFITRSQAAGKRCVRVIHGKGLGSPGRVPVLKSRVPAWLVQKRQVLAFVQASAPQGGAGALLVLLARAASKPPAHPP